MFLILNSELLVVLSIPSASEQQPAEWTEPTKHVIHKPQIDHLDEVPVEILDEEKCMAARRSFGLRQTLDALAFQVLIPAVGIPYVETEMSQADLIPWTWRHRHLRLEFEDLEYRAAWRADPADLAARLRADDVEETADAIRRRIGDAN